MCAETNGGRERAFEALRRSEELHRVVLQNISDAVLLTDDEGAFTFICPNVDVLFGYSPDEVQGFERIGRLLGENLYDRAQLAAEGEIRNIERVVTAKSGQQRSVLVHVKKVSIQAGTVLFACRDVTDRRAAEDEMRAARAELAHVSRLAIVGELAASISHEISQPLTAVFGNAGAALHLLDGGVPPDQIAALREILKDIHTHSGIVREVIDRLRTLARKQALELDVLDVNEVLSDLLKLVRSEAQLRGITLQLDLDPALPRVSADRVCLRQAVLNLITNAMDALNQAASERLIVLRTRREQNGVEISVSDTGPGIPLEHLPKLFDAFFTTKKEGVGLGLAIARSLVEAQGGQLSVANYPDRGATFSVTLPRGAPMQ